MRRQANDYRDHHHGGRDTHHHHHHLGHHHGPGGGGSGSGASQVPPPPLHHHHHHHHHQQPHHTHHRQNSSHFHHPIQHRSSSSSQSQHIRPNTSTNQQQQQQQQNRHRSRTSSLSMGGLDMSPMPGSLPPPPAPTSMSSSSLSSSQAPSSASQTPSQLSQLDARISEMQLNFGGKSSSSSSSRDRLSSPLLTSSSSTAPSSHHHHHNNPSPNNHHHHHHHHHHPNHPNHHQQQQQQQHGHHNQSHHPHRRSYLGSSSGSSGSSSGGSMSGLGGNATTSSGNNNNININSSISATQHSGMMNSNNNNSGGNLSSALTSPSHSSAVLSRLERKKRLLACLDGGTTAPPVDDIVAGDRSGDRLNSSGCATLNNTSLSSRTAPSSLPNPPNATHVAQNGLTDPTLHGSISSSKMQQNHYSHHNQHSLSHSSPHHHQPISSASASLSSHHHQHHQQQQQHLHHHNLPPSSHRHHDGVPVHHNSSSTPKTPTLHNSQSLRSPLNHASALTQPHHHQTKSSSSSSAFSMGSPLTTNHMVNNNNNVNDNINNNNNKTPISTTDLNRRFTYLTSHKSSSTNSSSNINNMNDNNSISSKKEPPMQASNTPSPLSTPYATHRSNSISSVSCNLQTTASSASSNITTATMGSAHGTSDKPKKTSSSYLLPNSIYNKAGPGQKSSTLSTYATQITSKGDDSRVIDIGSQAINVDAQDPRLMKIQERVGSVLTTITNNEDYLIATKINSLLDEQIHLDSVSSSELSRRNKLKNPLTTSLADSTTHKIDDQGSSEVSSSSDADLTKILHATNRPTTTATATTNIISKKSVMNLPLPKFACIIQTSETTIIKKPTPDRELTTVSSSNKLLLNKTPLISLTTTRSHLSPSSLASFSSTTQAATASVTPMVDYSKFNIRKKNPSTSISSLDHHHHASSNNGPSVSASSDDEKTSPTRTDVETLHNLEDSEEQSSTEKSMTYERPVTPPSPIIDRKLSVDSNESLKSPDIKTSEKFEPQNVIKRRVSADDRPQRRLGSMSPQKESRDKIATPDHAPLRSKPATPEIKPMVAKNEIQKAAEKPVDTKSTGKRVEKEHKASKTESSVRSKTDKQHQSPPTKVENKATKDKIAQEEKKKLSSIVARDLGSSDSSSCSDLDDKSGSSSDESSSSSAPSPPRRSMFKETEKSDTSSKKKSESKKLTRKKFELNHNERTQTKVKGKGKNKKLKADDEPSSKIKGVTKRSIKNRGKNKSNMKNRDKTKQKKSSLFDFDFEEPIYLSMYDKVKARSSANHTVTPPVSAGADNASTSSKDTPAVKESSTKEPDQKEHTKKKSTPKEPQLKETSTTKEPAKQRKQKRQPKVTKQRSRKDSSESESETERKPRAKEVRRERERSVSSSPVKSKTLAASTAVVTKKPTKKTEKRFSAKDFVLRADDMKPKSPSTISSSTSHSSSSSSSASSSSSSSSVASLSSSPSSSSSSDDDVDEDAELSAIVAETAGRIGDEMNINETANSPQLSPPPSPMAMETNFLMTPSEAKPSTNIDELMARSSESWSTMVSQPLHINLSQLPSHSAANTPSPRKSGPSDLILSSPSICAKSLNATPECSPHDRQVSSLASESSTLDNRCETEQAISTLLQEMDTDSSSEQQLSRDLLIEVDTRTSMSNQTPSPRKSPIKMPTPPLPKTPSPPILQQHQRQPTPPISQPKVTAQSIPTPPPPTLSPIRGVECSLSPLIVQPAPVVELVKHESIKQERVRTPSPVKQSEPLKRIEMPSTPDMKPSTPELPPLQPISIPSPTQHVAQQHSASRDSPSKTPTDAQASQTPKLVGDTQAGKHALRDEISPSTDDSRPDVKRVRRNRKKSHQSQSNQPSIDVNTPRLSAGQQPKMSPYDIFEFRDSDDEETTSAKAAASDAAAAAANVTIKTPGPTGPCSVNTSPITSSAPSCKVDIIPPISTNLLQTVASMQVESNSPPSPKLPLNLAQPIEALQKTPPQPAVSPSGSSNENKDPAPKSPPGSVSVTPDITSGLLQTVELKTEILKSMPEVSIKHETSEETLESIEAATQRQREYVTELNQDGKLSLTIRKASNQARELVLDSRAVGKQGSTSSEVSSVVENELILTASHGNEGQIESGKSTTPQPGSSANIKPTRRSARLMQTTRKDPADDEQTQAKETIATLPSIAPTVKPKTGQNAPPLPSKETTNAMPVVDNQSRPAANAPAKEASAIIQQSIGETLKESQPTTDGDQVAEPPVKTRRYTRGKKVKQQPAPPQPPPTLQQQTQLNPQTYSNQPQLQNQSSVQQQAPIAPQVQQQQTKFASQPETSQAATTTQVATVEGRRPKRLTRLAAKTFGGTAPEQPAVATEPIAATSLQQPLTTQTPMLPHSHQPAMQPTPTQPPMQSAYIPQAPRPLQQQHMPALQPTPPSAVQQLSSAVPESNNQPQVQATQLKPSFSTSSNEPSVARVNFMNDENSALTTSVIQQPIRNSTPIVATPQPAGGDKGALFCIPSYLPPRKRLGWFWSQKQLLEQRYLVVWTSRFTLKDSFAAVQMHFISGNNKMPSWSYRAMLDETGMPLPIQINQRMRLEPDQLEGVQRKLANDEDHCVLLAIPVGRDMTEYLKQSNSMKVGFIDYLTSKEAAGIVYVCQPGETQPSYIIHIFPSCAFVNDHILQREPDLLNVTQNIDNLIVVITTA